MHGHSLTALKLPKVLLGCVVATSLIPPSSHSSIDNAVRPITAYVATYGEQASVILASERYTQTAETNSRSAYTTVNPGNVTRTLVSDFAIAKTSLGWVGFRDVLSVDGRKIRDHDDRLVRLITAGVDGIENARRISDESARYNIGFAVRNFNVPTMALFLFSPERVSRFQFAEAKRSAEEIHLAYHEADSDGLIHRKDGAEVPISGEVWARSDGTVTRTTLRMTNIESVATEFSRVEIDVTYRLVPDLQMWLPALMTELYEGHAGVSRRHATGRAEYSNYRRFQTSVRIK